MGAAAAALTVGGAAYSAYQQGEAGKASSSYYSYLSETARLNAGLARTEATAERLSIGRQENAEQIALTNRVNEAVGTQTAAVVNGVGASSRSAQDIIGDTLDKGNLDELALRLNADMKAKNAEIGAESAALNYNSEAAGYRMAGNNAVRASRAQQVSSLLGGAGSVANSWYVGKMYAGRTPSYGGKGDIGSIS